MGSPCPILTSILALHLRCVHLLGVLGGLAVANEVVTITGDDLAPELDGLVASVEGLAELLEGEVEHVSLSVAEGDAGPLVEGGILHEVGGRDAFGGLVGLDKKSGSGGGPVEDGTGGRRGVLGGRGEGDLLRMQGLGEEGLFVV